MRRILCSLFAAATLAGCASTGYYREEGAADYYYERDSGYSSYYGAGYHSFYDPFWGSSYFGVSSWPYGYGLGYGYGSYYAGWPYYSSPWYDSWWGVGYNDWSWHRHQQALINQRGRDVRRENAAVAGLRGSAPDRDGAAAVNRGASRMAAPADRGIGPDRWGNADATRQLGTGNVDPYYGSPRIRRGEGPPQRQQPQLGGRETPQRTQPIRNTPGFPIRENRPIRTGPAFNEGRMDMPAPQRAPAAPIRNSAPAAAPARSFAPAPAMDRSPAFTPRSAPSAPSRSGDSGRTERR